MRLKDWLFITGGCLLIAGCWLIHASVALIVLGLGIGLSAVLIHLAEARK